MTRTLLLLLSLIWIHTATNQAEAAPNDQVSSMETPFDTSALPFLDEAVDSTGARSSFCSQSVYCPGRDVTISCTAEGNNVSCSAGANWVRCQAGSQVSANRC